MELTVLCIGDVVGKPGRSYLARTIPVLRRLWDVDLVVVNAENAAGGSGLTPQIFDKLMKYGVDAVTLGDHCYRRGEIVPVLERDPRIIRPANMPPQAAGKRYTIIETNKGVSVGLVLLLGRMYMNPADCPFRTISDLLEQIRPQTNVILVEMHAEATSEKVAMGWNLDGKVSLIYGTHTHVPTADGRVLPGGTGYISDIGMTGPYDSVLGRDKRKVINSLTTGMPNVYNVAENDLRTGAILTRIDTATGKALSIEQKIVDEDALAELESKYKELKAASEQAESPATERNI